LSFVSPENTGTQETENWRFERTQNKRSPVVRTLARGKRHSNNWKVLEADWSFERFKIVVMDGGRNPAEIQALAI
jgi:hypothetical protein